MDSELIWWEGGWNGGSFSNKIEIGDKISVVYRSVDETSKGVVVRRNPIHGCDFDHGHNYPWTFTDYIILFEDKYEVSLLHLCKGDKKVNAIMLESRDANAS